MSSNTTRAKTDLFKTPTAPLLTTSGNETTHKPPSRTCSTKGKISIVIVCLIFLVLALTIAFAVDWTTNDSTTTPRRSNRYWQTQYLSLPSNDSCKQIATELASTPHVAGYPEQEVTGQYIKQFFEDIGIKTMTQEWRDTVLDHFISSNLQMSTPGNNTQWTTLNISEEPIESDPDTFTEYRSHIWNAYSANASVEASIIYINYGRRSDYELLINDDSFVDISSNASFVGKIGLVRYGQMGRATKVKIAQDYGIIGLLMFSDPAQYAPDQSMVYPNGPWLPPTGVQRGSIKIASCPGNPQLARMQDLCGIDSMEEAVPSIPVMPLSYKNAEILFSNMMDAEIAPSEWQGGIDVEYRVNSEQLRIRLTVEADLRFDDLTQNVYGMIEGDEFPEQIVMIGAHRDAWVYGAQDDVSGTVTILEVAKGLSEMYKNGWRPRRTMIFASFDSEESGLIGSTNLGEIMMINDMSIEGMVAYLKLCGDTFNIAGNPLLRTVSEDAMRFTPLNNAKFGNLSSFYDKYTNEENQFGILGQGSDHTVFAFYVGIAALDTGFGGETAWGAYHSVYDTLQWQETVDKDWMLAEDIARFCGILTLKLLDEVVLPFDLEIFASTMKQWFTENVMKAMDDYECNPNGILNENVVQSLLDSIEEFEDGAIEINEIIMELRNKTEEESYSESSESSSEDGVSVESLDSVDSEDVNESEQSDSELITQFNTLLASISKVFMYSEGLPERTWHKNILWNVAIEDGPSNVFPYIWYALEWKCEEEMLRESFDITQNIIDGATEMLQRYLVNTTSSTY